MARNPRTVLRILTFARLSMSSTGWATSRRKWFWQVAVRDAHTLLSNGRDEGILLLRHPHPDRLVQALGPLTGQDDQPAHLLCRTREQGLSKPHPLAHQLTHHIQRFMAFFRLQTVDCQHERLDIPVGLSQLCRV